MTTEPPTRTDDPIAYFIEDLEHHGRSRRTCRAYERVLRRYEEFLTENTDQNGTTIRDVGHRDCMEWVHSLRSSYSRSTVATYATYLHRFYSYMNQVGAFDSNPMVLVAEEMNEAIDKNPRRRDVTLPAMREFVAGISHPLDRAVVVCLLKTGIRVGELCNLDVRDLSLSDDDINTAYPIDARGELANRRNALLVRTDISANDVVNDEQRAVSNKRKRATVIPVDDELRSALRDWLAIRPDAVSSAEPLFLSTGSKWGERLKPAAVGRIVRKHARARDWYRTGGGATENVTPHYFRHFFTTYLRDRTGDRGVVKYLRGDVASDVIDTYTHDWGDRIRNRYLENIYTLS